MDDRKLETLKVVIKTGSFSKAAAELNCTQSAVTQMMNSLEGELQCKVLERNHSGVKLAKGGELLLPYIIEACDANARLLAMGKRYGKEEEPLIRIGAFSSISNTWLPGLLSKYQDQNPRVKFELLIGTDMVADWLAKGKVDVGLGDSERCRMFRWHPLQEDIFYAVINKQMIGEVVPEAISQEDFCQYPFLMAPMNTLSKHLHVKPSKQISVVCDDDTTLLSMVSQGIGVTAMPKLSFHHMPENVVAIPIVPEIKRTIGIAVQNSPSKSVQRFVDYIISSFKEK